MTARPVHPGSRPFQRADNARFFGRTAEAAYVGEIWRQNRLTFLCGPAGIGKTSLLAAGILPLVEDNRSELLPVGELARGSSSPSPAPGAHTPYSLALLRSWSPPGMVSRLRRLTVDDFLARRAEIRSRPVLAAIDHADDLFAGPGSRDRDRLRFLRELEDALAEPTVHLLISVRDDALPRFTAAIGEGVQFHLGALDPDDAYRVVEGPGGFAADAAGELVRAVRTSRVLGPDGRERLIVTDQIEPALLEAARTRLQESLRARSGEISLRELRRRGDVNGVLSGYCGAAIAAVADLHGIPVRWLRRWLISTFVTEIGELGTAAEGEAQTAGMPTPVARALEDRHLLRARTDPSGSSRLYHLISDRLIEPLRLAPDDVSAPEDPAGYLRAAERALVAGELDLAGQYAAKVRVTAPDTALRLHAEAVSLLGNLAYERDDLARAEACYREAAGLFEAARDPDAVARLLAAASRTLSARGRLADAVSLLSSAVQRMPADATIQTELSTAIEQLSWRLGGGQGPVVSPG
ncbi:MAG TPA: hypothetical protein VN969_10015 [Streptosporangiaceae bacterium]|nr:hypothetical protein [Streptosporangiaceae bacterium]